MPRATTSGNVRLNLQAVSTAAPCTSEGETRDCWRTVQWFLLLDSPVATTTDVQLVAPVADLYSIVVPTSQAGIAGFLPPRQPTRVPPHGAHLRADAARLMAIVPYGFHVTAATGRARSWHVHVRGVNVAHCVNLVSQWVRLRPAGDSSQETQPTDALLFDGPRADAMNGNAERRLDGDPLCAEEYFDVR